MRGPLRTDRLPLALDQACHSSSPAGGRQPNRRGCRAHPARAALLVVAVLLVASRLVSVLLFRAPPPRHSYRTWSEAIKRGECRTTGPVVCSLRPNGSKVYVFPAGIFEIDEQLLIPEKVTIIGARSPNNMARPDETPDWKEQTLFLATRGVSEYRTNYCHADDMVSTRVGFVLSSYVRVINVSYQGLDVIRPMDNGALCGGGAFETKGCAENDCRASAVNNGGSDGLGCSPPQATRLRPRPPSSADLFTSRSRMCDSTTTSSRRTGPRLVPR